MMNSRFIVSNIFCNVDRGLLHIHLVNSYLGTTTCPRWSQSPLLVVERSGRGKIVFIFYINSVFVYHSIFTVGHTSSQYSESLNSSFQDLRFMKQKMNRQNISQLVTWLDNCVHRIYSEIFIEIRKVINPLGTGKLIVSSGDD